LRPAVMRTVATTNEANKCKSRGELDLWFLSPESAACLFQQRGMNDSWYLNLEFLEMVMAHPYLSYWKVVQPN
jgi:hypothetical protein